ncbi:acyl carrier protein [Mycetocola spongiae]|uniref:acyl carrier protein n=1 Tax=Mycetocola spongiae TaxID=2859226 RepID=UPI001CF3B061|nr:phosphopantetheine-binding protein [Mycetocola spongiae]UCR88461.1 acyl carrier protein [Mycetocola spongiae]
MTTHAQILERATARTQLNSTLKRLIAEGLDLPVSGDQIEDDQPLFGRGLELDSLDTLEIVSLVEEEFEVYITDDEKFVFGSINKICDLIEREQAK